MRAARLGWAGVLVLALAGCVEEVDPSLRSESGSASAPAGESGAAPAAVPAAEIAVTVRDCQVALGAQSVNAGTVSFNVRNEGGSPQELVLRGPQGDFETGEIPAGSSAMLSVALAAGTYELACAAPPADASQVQGATLVVH